MSTVQRVINKPAGQAGEGELMKVFVPMSDELLDKTERSGGRLVPFNPEFLEANAREGRKPSNWIADDDYTTACRRLRESRRETEFA